MNFQEALKELNIEDYSERIWHSNSHGELFHIYDYIELAEIFREVGPEGAEPDWFRTWFVAVVKEAEKRWQRPESVFQHIRKLLLDELLNQAKKRNIVFD